MSTQKAGALLVSSIAVVLLLSGLVLPSRAAADTYHETYFLGFPSGCGEGGGADFLLECDLVNHVLTRPNGSIQGETEIHCQGSGINPDSGTEYIVIANQHYGWSFDPATFYPLTTISVFHLEAISLGPNPNQEIVATFRMVINANGELANYLDSVETVCHGQ
jgi:hypothetical protein